MKIVRATFITFVFLLRLCQYRVMSETLLKGKVEHVRFPPRGWNSYDSFCWTISEEEFLKNAQLVSQRLRAHGYEYVVVDYLWYRRKVEGAYTDSLGFDVIDEWGRMVPDPVRWPSSVGGKGFTEVAKKVHNMGLKFGIHVMRGISTQAFNSNTLILNTLNGSAYENSGRQWRAKDIGLKERACAWMPHGFMSVDTKLDAGRAFLRSLYVQYAEWGVDFVKHDCVFGDDLDIAEISFVSEVLKELDRPILYSLSPGSSVSPAMAKEISGLVNMYRITGDDWDNWEDVASHFNVARDFANAKMIGHKGLNGKSWPDLDMLPLGWLTDPGSNQGPHRSCNLNLNEQRTQMTLWSMSKSPLMFGGDMRKLDNNTYELITNPTLLDINSFSSNNMEFLLVKGTKVPDSVNPYPKNQAQRLRKVESTSDGNIIALVSCNDIKANFWSNEALQQDVEQVCWKDNSRRKVSAPLCLKKKMPRFTSIGEVFKQHSRGTIHLLANGKAGSCLDGSRKRKLTSKEFKRVSFSPCAWPDTNQMWELNPNGTLINNYSGLCATVTTTKANVNPGGVRSWIATGRRGEIYIAFFNLNLEKTTISAKISDLAKALRGKFSTEASYKSKEIWSGKDYGVTKEMISIEVDMHGSALIVLEKMSNHMTCCPDINRSNQRWSC